MGRSVEILDAATSTPLQGGPSFTLSNRLYRALWIVCWATLAAWTPPGLADPWRRALLRLFGANIGAGARIYGGARIWFPPNLRIDARATVASGVRLYCIAPIRIGEGAIVSQGAHLCTGSHDIDDPAFQLIAHPIRIGSGAWIAAEAFVGPGVTVGEGAVLGARGVACSDLAPHTVYAGNPAVAIGRRQISV